MVKISINKIIVLQTKNNKNKIKKKMLQKNKQINIINQQKTNKKLNNNKYKHKDTIDSNQVY